MKRITPLILSLIIIIPFINNMNVQALNFPLNNAIKSESAIVLNIDNDIIIHEKNADTKQMPGSLVNIMTAIICLENTRDLSKEITVDKSVFADLKNTQYPEDLRSADIFDGDVLTVNDLLYAMMLTSSYEAAQTLAYHYGDGSVESFVKKMNEKAAEIGCKNTNFVNPTGIYDDNQYTTARDMMLITRYAMNTSIFTNIATTKEYNPTVPNLQNHKHHNEWIWTHSNLMMDEESDYYYRGAKGIKTGNLTAAGRNIIAMAGKDGHNYLVVLLKAPIRDPDGKNQFYHIDDAISVFNWAFNNFSYRDLVTESEEIAEVSVDLADGTDYVLLRPEMTYTALWYDKADTALIKKDIQYVKDIKAPIKAGDKLGVLQLMYSGEEIATVNLVAVSDVERSASKFNLYVAKRFKDSEWFKKAFIVSGLLCLIYIVLCAYSFICYKNNSKAVKPIYAMPKAGKRKKKKSNKDE